MSRSPKSGKCLVPLKSPEHTCPNEKTCTRDEEGRRNCLGSSHCLLSRSYGQKDWLTYSHELRRRLKELGERVTFCPHMNVGHFETIHERGVCILHEGKTCRRINVKDGIVYVRCEKPAAECLALHLDRAINRSSSTIPAAPTTQ